MLMEDFDKIRTISRCVYVNNLIDAAKAMLDECRFGRDGKMIVSEETDRILKLELELKEIKKKVENLIKTI
jgi:hypothetical protein